MPNKKKETAGLLVAVAPVAIKERDNKYSGGLLEDDRERYAEGSKSSSTDKETRKEYLKRIKQEHADEKEMWDNFVQLSDDEQKEIYNEIKKERIDLYEDLLGETAGTIVGTATNYADQFMTGLAGGGFDNIGITSSDKKFLADLVKEKVKGKRDMKYSGGLLEDDRERYAEGGEQEEMQLQEGGDPEVLMPPPLPQEDEMVSDDQMEDDYLNFVVSQSLSEEEESYLMETLTADPQLSVIFDKVMDVATEFSGAGPVDGPGSEVSDSIPARLSDGEFVLTAKATDEIGPENLEAMMQDAEARSDKRQMAALGGMIQTDPEEPENLDDPETEEIRKNMLSVNPRLQTG